MRTIEVITTGGTIEKTYDARTGDLANTGSIVHRMLRRLSLPDTRVHVREVMSKDSRDMGDADRATIVEVVRATAALADSIVVLHGTDTLTVTGEALLDAAPHARVVLTGAMRPFEMKRSDALQNLTEALLASTIVTPGVYCAFHGKVLRLPGVRKDYEKLTFVKD
ncbi:MAG: asparaginase domain-containing protein [Phycisphaerales bacterium]